MGQEALAHMWLSAQVASDVTLFTCLPSEELRYEQERQSQETANTVVQSNLRTTHFVRQCLNFPPA
jgi:hypothetical protein